MSDVPPHDALAPEDLAGHYSQFRVTARVLLTGHSHQAWPDVALDAQQRAWLDAADLVDDKWSRAAEIAEQVREGWRRLLNEPNAEIALGQNTHELVTRVLSAVLDPAKSTPRDRSGGGSGGRTLVTTDGEFHTIRRQIDRLEEAGVEIIRVAARPVDSLAARISDVMHDRVACVLVSSVLYETAEIVPDLDTIARACARHGAELLVDAYHHLNVVPFNVQALGLERAFIVGGGYKYCQLGEGNCFLRVPPDCELRPVITGWFSEFADLAAATRTHEVRYGTGAARFAGATYDPTSHYRAAAVFAFHQSMRMTPDSLRDLNVKQTAAIERAFQMCDVNPQHASLVPISPARRAGFVAIRTLFAGALVVAMRACGVYCDARGGMLRLGPAPYVSNTQLQAAVEALADALARAAAQNPTD